MSGTVELLRCFTVILHMKVRKKEYKATKWPTTINTWQAKE